MAGPWTSERFPQFADAIRRLMEQHLELDDEPLHLAMAYKPGSGRDPRHIYLLEVIGNSGGLAPSEDRELFETVFGPRSEFPMNPDERLHLVLTYPEEFRTAVREDWSSIREIVEAIRTNEFQLLHEDEEGRSLLAELQELIERAEGAAHG